MDEAHSFAHGQTSLEQQNVKLVKDLANHEVVKVLKKVIEKDEIGTGTQTNAKPLSYTPSNLFEMCLDKRSGWLKNMVGKFFINYWIQVETFVKK